MSRHPWTPAAPWSRVGNAHRNTRAARSPRRADECLPRDRGHRGQRGILGGRRPRSGVALGGGLELALCADFRVAGESAKFGVPEILLGVIPGLGGTQRLPRLIGPARAKNLIYTGRFVDAEEALRIGLVDQVVPDADVYRAATTLAGQFVSGPALALRAAKEAIDTGLEVERLHFAALFATEDQKLGMESFVASGPGHAKFAGK